MNTAGVADLSGFGQRLSAFETDYERSSSQGQEHLILHGVASGQFTCCPVFLYYIVCIERL